MGATARAGSGQPQRRARGGGGAARAALLLCALAGAAQRARANAPAFEASKACAASRLVIVAATGEGGDGVSARDLAEAYYAVAEAGGSVDVFTAGAPAIAVAPPPKGDEAVAYAAAATRVREDARLSKLLASPAHIVSVDGVSAIPRYNAVLLLASTGAAPALKDDDHLATMVSMFASAGRAVVALGQGQLALAGATDGDGALVKGRSLAGTPGAGAEGTASQVLASLGATLTAGSGHHVDANLITAAKWHKGLAPVLLGAMGCKMPPPPSIHDEL